ncbi:MAG: 2-amino-4-hydroxy-6-hydroxymethyldihydropteridine diphosphokinase [Fervidobacterium sp.]
MDLDILFYGNLIIESETLVVPHYDFENRTFFIEPMKEISPDFVHPLLRKHMKNF